MFNSLKIRGGNFAASDNEQNRYYVKPAIRALLSFLLLPPCPAFGSASPVPNLSPSKVQKVQDYAAIFPDFVTDEIRNNQPAQLEIEFPRSAESKALPLGWLLGQKERSLSQIERERSEEVLPDTERILARLAHLEAHEPEASFRDDYRIAWLIVHHCAAGDAVECSPAVLAWYTVLGCHPDQVFPKILARRKAILGPKFTQLRKLSCGRTGAELSPRLKPAPAFSQKKETA